MDLLDALLGEPLCELLKASCHVGENFMLELAAGVNQTEVEL